MKSIYISDVGDGLCSLFVTKNKARVQLDSGGESNKVSYEGLVRSNQIFGKPDFFILSHFHLDHYKGLISPKLTGKYNIQKAYFPSLPKFTRNKEFLNGMIVLALITYGAKSGSIECDFLESISRLNKTNSIEYQPLYEGYEENISGTKIEVLWPPRSITDKRFTNKVKSLIKKYEKLLEKDEELRKRHEDVYESEMIWKYKNNKNIMNIYQRNNSKDHRRGKLVNNNKPTVSKEISDLNDEFKEVANRISLAFKINNDFLFLGDLEKNELKNVMKKLDGYHYYNVLLNPHHGTHWEDSMYRLKTKYSISSIGKTLIKNYAHEFKSISSISLATYCSGNIYLRQPF